MKDYETRDDVDDAITEYGHRAVAAGLHRLGRPPTQEELDRANRRDKDDKDPG